MSKPKIFVSFDFEKDRQYKYNQGPLYPTNLSPHRMELPKYPHWHIACENRQCPGK